MLVDYVKNDYKYKSYALKICGCETLKDDMVNDMYLKMHEIFIDNPEKKISDRYAYLMLKSIFLDIKRKNREYCFEKVPEIRNKENNTEKRKEINSALSEMIFFDREILLTSQEVSFREIGRKIECHHSSVSKMYNKSLRKLKKICLEKGIGQNE